MNRSIKWIIPAKSNSERVENKNWRPFRRNLSLVDIAVLRLVAAGVDASDIYISCDREDVPRSTIDKYGANLLLRSPHLCDNDVPLTTWIRSITSQIPGKCDIGWRQVCDPFFAEDKECIFEWNEMVDHNRSDSLVVCRPWKGYLLDENKQPIRWSFGEHHTPSQDLPMMFTMPFTLSILTREAIARTGYHVGAYPHWYVASGRHIDIDTEEDFKTAQIEFTE